MKRPENSLAEEPGTLPLGGADPTQALPGAPGPRLVLGRYRLERRLGAGGFGVVWLAWDEKLEREVAVKAIPREDGSGERVEREARAAARLNHPGIVAMYELAYDEHEVYLVSELVRGRTLAELVRANAIADRDVARIGAALCDALAHAHERGVIHRDVKPQNVMVVADPAAGAGFAKLADFGVAHVVSDAPLTMPGDVVGTLAYMAPEQADGASSGAAEAWPNSRRVSAVRRPWVDGSPTRRSVSGSTRPPSSSSWPWASTSAERSCLGVGRTDGSTSSASSIASHRTRGRSRRIPDSDGSGWPTRRAVAAGPEPRTGLVPVQAS